MGLKREEMQFIKDMSEAGKTDILKVKINIQLPRLEFKTLYDNTLK